MAGLQCSFLLLAFLSCSAKIGNAQNHGDVRLVGGHAGYLQVNNFGSWEYVCGRRRFFNDQDTGAKVVCRETGFPTENPRFVDLYDYHSRNARTGNVRCLGNESRIADCKMSSLNIRGCDQYRLKIACSTDNPCTSSPCPEGHTCIKISDLRHTCQLNDHCALSPCFHGNCSQGNETDYTCTCQQGWRGRNCSQDIDECGLNNGDCEHACVNEDGSYKCFCRHGFSLSNDEKSCNECYFNGKRCDHTCFNTTCEHTSHCKCFRGYKLALDGYSCQDINECNGNHGCEHNCVNTPGSYQCACRNGYYLGRDTKRCFQKAENIIDVCTCRLRVQAPTTGLGSYLMALVHLKYGEKILWAVDRNNKSAYRVADKHPGFLNTRRKRENGNNAEDVDTYKDDEPLSMGKDCLKMYKNCPRDCMRMTEVLLGDEGFERLTETEVYGHVVNTTFGQMMCNRLKKRIPPPGVGVMVSFYPRGCGSEVSFYKHPTLLCCERVSSPLLDGFVYLWNKLCVKDFNINNLFRAIM